MNNKLCPLMSFRSALSPIDVSGENVECIENDCAWYNTSEKFCAILSLSNYLCRINEDLQKKIKVD